jgi:hypothetical protein
MPNDVPGKELRKIEPAGQASRTLQVTQKVRISEDMELDA